MNSTQVLALVICVLTIIVVFILYFLWLKVEKLDRGIARQLKLMVDMQQALDMRMGKLDKELYEVSISIKPLPGELQELHNEVKEIESTIDRKQDKAR